MLINIQKVISYEKGASGSSWAKSALLICGDWVDQTKELNEIASNNLQKYTVHKLYFQGHGDFPDPTNINKYLNPPNGVGFVAYVGHANYNGWAIGPEDRDSTKNIVWYYNGDLTTQDSLDELKNSDRLPVVFSTGCHTGQFITLPPRSPYRDVHGIDHQGTDAHDHQGNDVGEHFSSTPPQPACIQPTKITTPAGTQITTTVESMAEGMLVQRMIKDSNGNIIGGTGSIAYIGSTIGGWTSTNKALLIFFEKMPEYKMLGELWLEMYKTYYKKYIPPNPDTPANKVDQDNDPNGYYYIVTIWHLCLFGDPSLRLGGISS
jgi:hypothetical protein